MSSSSFAFISTSKSFKNSNFVSIIGLEKYDYLFRYLTSHVYRVSRIKGDYCNSFSNILNCLLYAKLNPGDTQYVTTIENIFRIAGVPPHLLKIIGLVPSGGFVLFYGGSIQLKFFNSKVLKVDNLLTDLQDLKMLLNYNKLDFESYDSFTTGKGKNGFELQHFFLKKESSIEFNNSDEYNFIMPSGNITQSNSIYLLGLLFVRFEDKHFDEQTFRLVIKCPYTGSFDKSDLNGLVITCIAGLLSETDFTFKNEKEKRHSIHSKDKNNLSVPRTTNKISDSIDGKKSYSTKQISKNDFVLMFDKYKVNIKITPDENSDHVTSGDTPT
jgi:hypothetical protein